MILFQFVWLFLVSIVGVGNCLSDEKLQKLAGKDGGIIKLTNSNFRRVLSAPRNSHIVVLLTATNPQIGCGLCVELGSEYANLANSWNADHPDGIGNIVSDRGLFFAKADFIDASSSDVFKYYKVNNVPRVFVFGPHHTDMDTYDALGLPQVSGNERVQAMIQALGELTGHTDFTLHEPFNWGSFFLTIFVVAIITFTVRRFSQAMLDVLTLRPVWGVLCVGTIITLIAGTMFNKIRLTPYVGISQDASVVQYIAVGQQQFQFGVETQIISVLYTALAIGFLLLTIGIPKIDAYYKRHHKNSHSTIFFIASMGFLLFVYLMYAALVGVFRQKNSSYPYRLFKVPFS